MKNFEYLVNELWSARFWIPCVLQLSDRFRKVVEGIMIHHVLFDSHSVWKLFFSITKLSWTKCQCTERVVFFQTSFLFVKFYVFTDLDRELIDYTSCNAPVPTKPYYCFGLIDRFSLTIVEITYLINSSSVEQIRRIFEDNLGIIFVISPQKHMH